MFQIGDFVNYMFYREIEIVGKNMICYVLKNSKGEEKEVYKELIDKYGKLVDRHGNLIERDGTLIDY